MGKYKAKKKFKFTQLKLKFYGFLVGFIAIGLIITVVKNLPAKNSIECANSISCIKNLSGESEATALQGVFLGNIVDVPTSESNTALAQSDQVLGESTSNKKILVDLTNQRLYAKEGDTTVYEFPVSTGKWGRTPTGTFKIWIKLRYTRMTGGRKEWGTYYNLPNVPYTMYFYNDEIPKHRGYGIHGAYWHNNFGRPMSHGCINVSPDNAGLLYAWANPPSLQNTTYASDENPGTIVEIFGTAPRE